MILSQKVMFLFTLAALKRRWQLFSAKKTSKKLDTSWWTYCGGVFSSWRARNFLQRRTELKKEFILELNSSESKSLKDVTGTRILFLSCFSLNNIEIFVLSLSIFNFVLNLTRFSAIYSDFIVFLHYSRGKYRNDTTLHVTDSSYKWLYKLRFYIKTYKCIIVMVYIYIIVLMLIQGPGYFFKGGNVLKCHLLS